MDSTSGALAKLLPLAEDLGVALPSAALGAFQRYLERLLAWNAKINLTSVTAPDEVVRKHFADSLALVPWLGDARTLVDVGSGGGFPGAVVALARPGVAITLVEPSTKRAAFLRLLVRELPLPRVEVRAERIEATVAALGNRFDAAVSRATWDLPEWLERGRALVHPGGSVFAMEGATQHELPRDATRHVVALQGVTRAIVELRVLP